MLERPANSLLDMVIPGNYGEDEEEEGSYQWLLYVIVLWHLEAHDYDVI